MVLFENIPCRWSKLMYLGKLIVFGKSGYIQASGGIRENMLFSGKFVVFGKN